MRRGVGTRFFRIDGGGRLWPLVLAALALTPGEGHGQDISDTLDDDLEERMLILAPEGAGRGETPFMAEESLGEAFLDAMGFEDLGEALDGVCAGEGDDGPFLLINGKPATDAQKASLRNRPASSIERIEILPPEAAAFYGATGPCGAINVILKEPYAVVFSGVSYREAGRGGGADSRGYGGSEHAGERFRRFVYVQTYDQAPLLEVDRNIVLPSVTDSDFFAAPGNVLAAEGAPDAEIDPALSARR